MVESRQSEESNGFFVDFAMFEHMLELSEQ